MKEETSTESSEQIRVENLTFSYPKRKPVLRGVSFHVHAGEIIGITGLSGSGKTTLLHCIAGVIPHVERGKLRGEVRVGGENVAGVSPAQISRKIGIVFQDPDNRMAATVVEDEIAFLLENMCLPPKAIRERVEEMLKLFRIGPLRMRSPQSLSGGEKQLVAIASVFAADPPVIVMDEPVSHLDEEGREKIRRLIRELKSMGRTILMAEHDFFHLDMADRILFLEDGVIGKEGSPAEMIPFLEAYLTRTPAKTERDRRENSRKRRFSLRAAKTAKTVRTEKTTERDKIEKTGEMTDGRREGPDHRKMPSLSEISPFPIGEKCPSSGVFPRNFRAARLRL